MGGNDEKEKDKKKEYLSGVMSALKGLGLFLIATGLVLIANPTPATIIPENLRNPTVGLVCLLVGLILFGKR